MSRPPVLCAGIHRVVLAAEEAPDEMSTIAGSLAAIFKLIEKDLAGINGRPVKARDNGKNGRRNINCAG